MRPVAYTVHPGERGVELVSEHFSFPAFLFAPVWLLVQGAWLGFLAWVVVVAGGIAAGLFLLPGSALPVLTVIGAGLHVGLEAGEIRRDRLARRGRPAIGVVMGETRADAEDRVILRARA